MGGTSLLAGMKVGVGIGCLGSPDVPGQGHYRGGMSQHSGTANGSTFAFPSNDSGGWTVEVIGSCLDIGRVFGRICQKVVDKFARCITLCASRVIYRTH